MPEKLIIEDENLIEDARASAAREGRALSDQIAHWARIGRTVSRSGRFDPDRIALVFSGDLETTDLSAEEICVWLDRFTEAMAKAGPEEEAFFAARRAAGEI
jgi:hypothetical protein